MKHTRHIRGSALVVLAIALFCSVLIGAGSASATVICTTESNPCESGSSTFLTEATGTAQLQAGTEAVFSAFFKTVKCTESTAAGKIESAGGAGATATGSLTTLTFSGCGCTTSVLSKGSLEVHYTSAGDGSVTGKGTELTFKCVEPNVSCKYGTGTGVTLGTVTGGEPATLKIEASLPFISGDSSSFVCGSTATFTATYAETGEGPMYIAGS